MTMSLLREVRNAFNEPVEVPRLLNGSWRDRSLEEETAAEHAEVDARAAKARESQTQLGNLQRQVDNAADALMSAESRKQYFVERIRQLKTLTLTLWGRPLPNPEYDPVDLTINSLTEAHQTIAACEAALADFPQAARLLEAHVANAKAKLAEFQKLHR